MTEGKGRGQALPDLATASGAGMALRTSCSGLEVGGEHAPLAAPDEIDDRLVALDSTYLARAKGAVANPLATSQALYRTLRCRASRCRDK